MTARALIAYAAKHPPYKKFYLVNQDYAYGRDYGAALKKEITRQIPSAQIVGEDYHPSHVERPLGFPYQNQKLRGRSHYFG